MTFSSVQNTIRILAFALAATAVLATVSHAQGTDPNFVAGKEDQQNQDQQLKEKTLDQGTRRAARPRKSTPRKRPLTKPSSTRARRTQTKRSSSARISSRPIRTAAISNRSTQASRRPTTRSRIGRISISCGQGARDQSGRCRCSHDGRLGDSACHRPQLTRCR